MQIKRLLFILLIAITFTNCSKRTDSLIVGRWNIEDVGQPSFPKDAYWEFYDDGRFDIYHDRNALTNSMVTGQWDAFSRSLVVPFIDITGLGPKGMDGKWRVETLNNKILVINRVEFSNGSIEGAFMRREFTRAVEIASE